MGRWLSADPAGPVDGPNLYQYVSGNPVRKTDPSGMSESDSGEELVRQEARVVPDDVKTEGQFKQWADQVGLVYSNVDISTAEDGTVTFKVGEIHFLNEGETAVEYSFEDEGSVYNIDSETEELRDIPLESEASGHWNAAGTALKAGEYKLALGEGLNALKRTFFPSGSAHEKRYFEQLYDGKVPQKLEIDPALALFTPAGPEVVAANAAKGGGGLVHLTTKAKEASIMTERVLRGPSGIYAGPASNASASGLGITLRTGLMPSQTGAAVRIPASATGAFSKPIPVGPITLWQRLTGQQFTAAGNLNLTTGAFTRTGINWNQGFLYGIDSAFTATAVGVGATYADED